MSTAGILIITLSSIFIIAGLSVVLWLFRKRLRKTPGNQQVICPHCLQLVPVMSDGICPYCSLRIRGGLV